MHCVIIHYHSHLTRNSMCIWVVMRSHSRYKIVIRIKVKRDFCMLLVRHLEQMTFLPFFHQAVFHFYFPSFLSFCLLVLFSFFLFFITTKTFVITRQAPRTPAEQNERLTHVKFLHLSFLPFLFFSLFSSSILRRGEEGGRKRGGKELLEDEH